MINIDNHIGRISISESYITEIVRHTVCDCFGVTDVCNTNTFRSAVSSITHGKLFKRRGVVIKTDKNGVTINLHIKVSYGTSIKANVKSIIHKVSFTVEEIAGVHVNSVNVFVDEMNDWYRED